jgi:tRNA(Ile)-lysidine synthase
MEQESMLKKIQSYIKEYDMLRAGDGVIVAVSGGADSVCLLSVLIKLAESGGWTVRALHVNHELRGKEADRDEAFVQELCSRLGVPLIRVRCDVAAYAAEQKLSVEEAGRLVRYEALEETARTWEIKMGQEKQSSGAEMPAPQMDPQQVPDSVRPRVRIAIAHHADDQAETILHHLLRGSSLRGLSGMNPVNGRRIRPLLCVRREEIRTWLGEQSQEWCEDSTNQHEDYTRNRIRNHILPMMTEEVNMRAVENIVRAGEVFFQADAYLAAQAQKILSVSGNVDSDRKEAEIRLDAFLAEPDLIRSYLVRQMFDVAAPGMKDLTAKHYTQVMELAVKQVGAVCDLPGTLAAERTYETLRVYRKLPKRPVTEVSETEDGLVFSTFPYETGGEIPKNQYTKWFDYDKINGVLSVRTRQNGDYITLSGGGRKTVNRFMIDEKIPKEKRNQIQLLADGHHILWIIGYRISEYYKVTAHTKYVLQVKKNGGESYV